MKKNKISDLLRRKCTMHLSFTPREASAGPRSNTERADVPWLLVGPREQSGITGMGGEERENLKKKAKD